MKHDDLSELMLFGILSNVSNGSSDTAQTSSQCCAVVGAVVVISAEARNMLNANEFAH